MSLYIVKLILQFVISIIISAMLGVTASKNCSVYLQTERCPDSKTSQGYSYNN